MYSLFHSAYSSIFAFCVARTHYSLTAITHDGVDILEVDVDVACHRDDFSYTFSSGFEHVVSLLESLSQFHVAILITELVVAYHEESIYMFTEFCYTFESLLLTAFTFAAERHSHDSDGEDIEFSCN